MPYKLVFSPVFKVSLRRLKSFLLRKFSAEVSETAQSQIRKVIEETLPLNPFMGPVCDRLLDLGVPGYRQLVIDKHNTVIYRIDEAHQELVVLLVFDSRQSLQHLLVDINLVL